MTSRRAARLLAGALVGALLLAGCSDGGRDFVPGPGRADIDVDSAELREAKQAAGIDDCVPGTGEPVEDGLPEVALPCFGGGPEVDLSSLRGPLVVNLWAQWCGPCRRELPIYEQLHQRHGDRVGVLGIDYEDPQPGKAMEELTESGATYPQLADPDGELFAADPFRVVGLPIVALVAEDGTVAYVKYQEVEELSDLTDLVEEHLGIRL
ncbi:TlpA disulfide reductase family protein [Nocardioides sp. SYSU D00038]|uniref:TlpA family protein disulfide reductase n=1 Tax=Nocardioides sp. SYSU D00038 TaxID=2812554 RepID=UPI001967C88C|nr:TlpA disulfide reductase family protein [Nocardioides sp. SYSU D00038]